MEEEKEQSVKPDAGTCECTDRSEADQSLREKEASSAIAFEDALHNQVYVKRRLPRKKRDAEGMSMAAAAKQARMSVDFDQVTHSEISYVLVPRRV